jgi:3-dehydroquinate synthase
MDPIRLEVKSAQTTYPVVIGTGVLARLGTLLAAEGLDRDLHVVSCPPVWRKHGRRLRALVAERPVALIPDGERAKTLSTVERIYNGLIKARIDRGGVLIAVGGGVTGDVAGFAAATYLRGIRFVQVPTTLLAQVDSAIGGKVGVNLKTGKNLVGAFHPPALVVCDPDVLGSLPAREFRAGLYEVIKYGVIASRELFDRVDRDLPAILKRDPTVLTPLIAECCRIKAAVVGADERETGLRRTLNFGHTIGHALESATSYRRFRHGEAIGFGMVAAARLSVSRGTLSAEDAGRLARLIDRLGARPSVKDLRVKDALAAIGRDKKVVAGRLHFVLADGLGSTRIATDVTTEELASAMRDLGMRR